MRSKLIFFVCLAFLSACATAPPKSADHAMKATPSPCSDSLYVALQSRPIETMTEREYAFFMQKDRECAEFRKSREEVREANRAASNAEAWAGGAVFLVILVGVLAIFVDK